MGAVPAREVDDAISAMHIAMKQLREAMKGIPDKDFGFMRSHEATARDAAHLTILLEEIQSH